MARDYKITAPDGTELVISGPENASKDQLRAAAQAAYKIRKATPAAPADFEGSSNQEGNTPRNPVVQGLLNIPKDALHAGIGMVKGVAGMVTSPMQTLQGLTDTGAGLLRNAVPAPVREFIDKADVSPALGLDPQVAQRASAMGAQVSTAADEKYGSLRRIKQSLIDRPVSTALDASAVLGVGGLLAPTKASASLLNNASSLTNPLTPIINAGGWLAQKAGGVSTQTGNALEEAYKAGKAGDKSLGANMRNDVPMSDVIDLAKQGVAEMARKKSEAYRSGMVDISKDKTTLGFGDIDKAMATGAEQATFVPRGMAAPANPMIKNDKAAEGIARMQQLVEEFKGRGQAYHTAEGFDALKQQLGAVLEAIPFEQKSARLAAGRIYSAVKDTIQAQAPGYAKTMAEYESASAQIKELERTLSIGDRAAQDTALRKLQSIMRNNANTNFGNRLDNVRALEQQGGVNLVPALAGQALNTWTPRGVVGNVGMGSTLASAGTAALTGNLPHAASVLGLIPLQSPRLMGEVYHGAGWLAGKSPIGLGQGANAVRLGGANPMAQLVQPEKRDW